MLCSRRNIPLDLGIPLDLHMSRERGEVTKCIGVQVSHDLVSVVQRLVVDIFTYMLKCPTIV